MRSLLPGLLVALFGLWAGTFAGGATAAGAAAGHLALLGTLLLVGADGLDPLRLGRAGRLLPMALVVALAASWWASPVPRAGSVGLLLLPAFLWLPSMVERCWRTEDDRRRGLPLVSLALAVASLWSLAAWLAGATPRPAEPLGQHTLLAAWLVTLLPLALVPARRPGAARWLGFVAGLLAVAALAASRSAAGLAALGVQAVVAAVWASRRASSPSSLRSWRPLPMLALAAAAVLAAALAPRALAVLSGDDPSARARAVYLDAGLAGLRDRPLLGHGPGSTPWTLAARLEPIPGVNPPGEVVGDLHSLPLQTAYELGLPGLLLAAATAALFVIRRLRELPRAVDRATSEAGLLGLAGAAMAALATAAIQVTALPLAAAVAAGTALAGGPSARSEPRGALPKAGTALALLLLARPDLAWWRYDRAVAGPVVDARGLARAVELDPGLPLYRACLAAHRGPPAAEEARAAAESSGAVAPLWLLAGALGADAGAPWAPAVLARACALSPLEALAPFELMLVAPDAPAAPRLGARALLAEPRLAAALAWEERLDLFAAAVAEARAWEGVDPGWREALAGAAPRPEERSGPVVRLGTGVEGEGAFASTYLFRRRACAAPFASVRVRRDLLDRLALPPATTLPTTEPGALTRAGCGSHPLPAPSFDR